ncbi:acyltransferase domain-containing protein [Teredinibacter turnerae]|uniref:acyltransferase domain-containing protein n=1 Tax=Teredinibacter turnerae TaxID=2426 RepID=UPI000ADADD60|nr:acyltransferase domain-containing protein [Teredinibacter turnerae]
MNTPLVFMYSGQGSQYFQMGADLYKKNARFRLWMDFCDEICLAELNGTSLVDTIYKSEKTEPFDKLEYSNPALIAIQYSLTRILMEEGVQPTHTIGYSLGSFVAAIVSGVIDLEQGLKFSIHLARLLEKNTPEARMLAVVASNAFRQEQASIFRDVWITGLNCDTNFVVSGLPESIDQLSADLKAHSVSTVQLPVRIGFHTPLIDAIESEFYRLLNELVVKQATIPLLSLHSKRAIGFASQDFFWTIFRNQVNFTLGVKNLLQQGFRNFIDVGPSGSLATFMKYIESTKHYRSLKVEPTLNQFGGNESLIARVKSSMSTTN